MMRRILVLLALLCAMASWAGVPTMRSFKTGEALVQYFGAAVPAPNPTDGGRFAVCYRSPDGQPPFAVYFELTGKGLADGKVGSTYYQAEGKTSTSSTFKAYRLQCATSPRATPDGVAQRSRIDSFKTMDEVFRYLGPAPIAKNPSEADYFAVCYASPQSSPPNYIIIEAQGKDIDTARISGGARSFGRRPTGEDLSYKNYRFKCAETAKVNEDLWTSF
jgi:hypothetical protein